MDVVKGISKLGTMLSDFHNNTLPDLGIESTLSWAAGKMYDGAMGLATLAGRAVSCFYATAPEAQVEEAQVGEDTQVEEAQVGEDTQVEEAQV
ncbi:MAG: hypothetical protein V4489_01395, partial [Chlamydiota bacterium]